MEYNILPSKPHGKVPRTVRISGSYSSLIPTFDHDREFIQSPSLRAHSSVFTPALSEMVTSVSRSMRMRPLVLKKLFDVVDERAETDYYPPVADLSIKWACHFLQSIAQDVPDPQVGAGPQGEVSFDWYDGRDHILTIGIHPTGIMHYAYASGNDRAHASWNLEKGLPDSLLGMLNSFCVEESIYAAW